MFHFIRINISTCTECPVNFILVLHTLISEAILGQKYHMKVSTCDSEWLRPYGSSETYLELGSIYLFICLLFIG